MNCLQSQPRRSATAQIYFSAKNIFSENFTIGRRGSDVTPDMLVTRMTSRSMNRRFAAYLSVCFAFMASVLISIPARADVRHLYDGNGRLTNSTNANGDSVDYQYDAAGNLISITRGGANGVSITQFTPTAGPVGTTVTITGTGFSTNAAENTVKFDDVIANVTSATSTELVVTVPSGAVSGPITVITPSGMATSSSSFTVGLPPPTIGSFTPSAGAAGVSVTITGTNFDTSAGGTSVQFNGVAANVTAVSSTSVTATVPSGATAGAINITTSRGTATSASDFVVTPPGVNAANVVAWQKVSIGGSAQTINISTTGKLGLFYFQGNQGDLSTLDVTTLTTSPSGVSIPYTVYSPSGASIYTGTLNNTVRSIHIPKLVVGGVYSVYFNPGSATAAIAASLVLDRSVTVDGDSLDGATTFAGQDVRFAFTVNSVSGRIGFGISGVALAPAGSSATVRIYKPDGSLLTSVGCNGDVSGCSVNLGPTSFGPNFVSLPTAGVYTAVFSPTNGATGPFKATVSTDATSAVPFDAPLTVAMTRPGQNIRLFFNGTAGQQLGLAFTNTVFSQLSNGSFIIYTPSGATLHSGANILNGQIRVTDIPVLPENGTYTLFVEPSYGGSMSADVVLSNDVQANIVADGASVNFSITEAGQTARINFDATAGQKLGFGISNVSLSQVGTGMSIVFFKPDGSSLGSIGCNGTAAGCSYNFGPTNAGPNFVNFPVSGTYTAVATTSTAGVTGSFTATLSSEVTGTLTADTPYNLSISRGGQNARLTFNGTAGQQLGLGLTSIAISPGSSAAFVIYKPDGTVLTSSGGLTNGARTFDIPVLPSTGTYTLYVEPTDAGTASMSVLISTDVQAALIADGAPTNVTLAEVGQSARLTFDAAAGQKLGLGLSNIVLSQPGNAVGVWIYKPDGTLLTSNSFNANTVGGSFNFGPTTAGPNFVNPPVSGTYTVVVMSNTAGLTGSFTATLSSETTGTITVDTPYNLAISRAGQNARLTFNGTAGQQLGLGLTSIAISPGSSAAFILYKPDGTVLTSSGGLTNGARTFDIPVLPSTGAYSLYIEPTDAGTASMDVLISSDVQAALIADGAPLNVTLSESGQAARLSFNASAGQMLGLGLSNITLSQPGNTIGVWIYKPDGSLLASNSFNAITTGGSFNFGPATAGPNFINLPVNGTYTMVVASNTAGLTGSFTATLSSELTGALNFGAPTNIAITRGGQNARYNFDAAAGQQLTVSLTNVSINPTSGTNVAYYVVKPDGTLLSGGSSTVSNGSTNSVNVASLPTTGTYALFVQPSDAATASFTVTLASTSPTVNAGVDQSAQSSAVVTLSGSAVANGGSTIASYAWTQTAGPAVTLSNANTATATFTAPQVSTSTVLTFRLVVTDNQGRAGADTINVTVAPANIAPTASAGADQTVKEGDSVTLTGSGTDSDGTIASYAWTQTAGPAVTLAGANTATASFTAPTVAVDTVLTFQLTVTDNQGATGSATTNVTVHHNLAPSVNAGVDQTVNENDVVSLTGSATDSDGTITSYTWTQTAGPAATLANANNAITTFTAPQVTSDTTLTFRLTATDNQGASTSATTNVLVKNVNQLPTANAGLAQTVNEGAAVTLSGSGTDADGTIASYAWTQTAGPAVTLANANTATATFTAPQVTANTVLTFQLTVTDNDGGTGSAIVNVTVNNVNQLPTANAGNPQTLDEGVTVTLSGSGSDPDGTIASYAWTQTGGPAVTLSNANTAFASFNAPTVATDTVLTFQLIVTDNDGGTATATTTVTVRHVNVAPTANAGVNQTVNEGAAVTLTGSGTDSDGTIASYAWTQTGGPAVTLSGANAATAIFTAPQVTADTVLTFQLVVTDNNGATGSSTTNVTVKNVNQLPTANAGVAQTVNEGVAVTLSGSGTDPDGTIASYAWTQTAGPAVTLSGANAATATFTAPQVTADTVLTFQLTVTDNNGGTGSATTNVTVKNVNQAPTANAGSNQTVNEGAVVTLSGSGSDPDGTIASYAWTQTAGPTVTLSGANSTTATFTAPQVTADTVLTFKLTVTDNQGATGSATTNVTVKNVAVAGIDLIVSSVSASASQANLGQSITISDTVTNQGSTNDTTSFTVKYYLSTDSTITTGDTSIGSRTISSLAAGASSSANTTVTIPTTLAPGTYYIGAIADTAGRVKESDETNNSLAGGTIVVIRDADLTMTTVSTTSTTVKRGSSITITNAVKNQGTSPTGASFGVGLYLSTDASVTTSDIVLATRSVSSLAGGASSSANTKVTIPTSVAPGTYYIGAIADNAGVISETDETNNARTGTTIVVQ